MGFTIERVGMGYPYDRQRIKENTPPHVTMVVCHVNKKNSTFFLGGGGNTDSTAMNVNLAFLTTAIKTTLLLTKKIGIRDRNDYLCNISQFCLEKIPHHPLAFASQGSEFC